MDKELIVSFYNYFLDCYFHYINNKYFIDFLTIIFVLILILQYNLIYNKNKLLYKELKIMQKIIIDEQMSKNKIEEMILKNVNEKLKLYIEETDKKNEKLKLYIEETDKKNEEFKKYITNKIISQNDNILIIKKLSIEPTEKINLSLKRLEEQFFKEKKNVNEIINDEVNGLLYSIETVEVELKNIINDLKMNNCLR